MELKPIRTGDPAICRGVTHDAAEQGQKVLRNTYLLLALTMVPTVIGAFIGMATAGVIIAHPIIGTFVMLGAVIGLQFGIAANRNSALGILLLLLMTGLLGWWLGPILNFALEMRNGAALVGYAALGTGAIFLAMGVIATTTKRDFGFMGKFLFVAMIANMWLQSPALALTISTLVIVVFSLFLLYDLSRIVRGGETNYVIATTGVYMSLFNIFANLLNILLMLGGERD